MIEMEEMSLKMRGCEATPLLYCIAFLRMEVRPLLEELWCNVTSFYTKISRHPPKTLKLV
jgi:hypothetical protein